MESEQFSGLYIQGKPDRFFYEQQRYEKVKSNLEFLANETRKEYNLEMLASSLSFPKDPRPLLERLFTSKLTDYPLSSLFSREDKIPYFKRVLNDSILYNIENEAFYFIFNNHLKFAFDVRNIKHEEETREIVLFQPRFTQNPEIKKDIKHDVETITLKYHRCYEDTNIAGYQLVDKPYNILIKDDRKK